jgi:ATP-dependent DNA helicase RecQ
MICRKTTVQIADIPTGWLLLDIERKKKANGKWKISEIALVDCTEKYHNKALERSTADLTLEKIKKSTVVLGHNIRRHDLATLFTNIPSWLNLRICDTLELSAFFLVGQQTYKLSKLYRQELGFSDPLEDAWESFELYEKVKELGKNLPPLVCYWAWQLLPDGYPLRLIPEGEWLNDWKNLEENFPNAEIKALQKYVEAIPKKPNINNLGIIIFLNWLYHLDKPLAHRPKWVEETFPQFREAEAITFPFLSQDYFSDIKLDKELKFFFGDSYSFRDNQLELVKAFLSKEVTPLGILPTGGGKSLTFQFPALLFSKYQRGLSVIISPLQALMMDQVQNLQEQLKERHPNYVDRVALLSGTQSLSEQKEIIDNLWQGKVDILYLSPERLRQPTIQRLLKHRLPVLWVLDEAHTLSQWGHDFRPDFMRIAGIIKKIYQDKMHDCRWGFVTATATYKVVEDLQEKVETINSDQQSGKLFTGKLEILPRDKEYFQWRKEITTYVESIPEDDRQDKMLSILETEHNQHPHGVAIVYVRFRKETERYAKIICDRTNLRAEAFHGRVTAQKKQEILQKFKDKQLDVVVATNAFGMGIDREGIHTVIHIAPPATPEAYQQEIGRLARKQGEQGKAYLFQDNEDFERTFNQENKSQISSQAMQGCWGVIKEKLKKGNGDAWVSTLDLEKHLESDDPEILATQTRTVLYQLEEGNLLREEESCPCILYIQLNNHMALASHIPSSSKNLVQYLKEIGIKQKDNAINLDVQEAALSIPMYPTKIINSVRQLAKSGIISWHYEITFKYSEKKAKKRIDEIFTRTQAFLQDLQEKEIFVEEENLIRLNNIESLEKEISSKNKNLNFKLNDALKLLTKLKLAKYEKKSRSTINFYFNDNQSFSHWIKISLEACEIHIKNIQTVETALSQVFELRNWNRTDSQLVDIAEIELQLENTYLVGTNPLSILNLMQGLCLIMLGRGDSNYDRLYHVVKGSKTNFIKSIYEPLRKHYEQRFQRVHAIKEVLKYEDEQKRIAVLRDYFLMNLDGFNEKYFPNIDINSPPIISDILNNLSDAQKEIVKDDTSRALLVLAGPGSGKTRTIVYRVAHLIAVSGVSPSRILVLSHTRTAAAEVRKRLYQLLGARGSQVDALTFHALASKLTGLRHNDAPDNIGRNASTDIKFDWLLTELFTYLQENSSDYQYILIDEYQDINELQYQIVKLLGSFRKDEDQDEQQDSFLVAVGDPNQNLFEFSGSSNKFINEFRRDWSIEDQPERCLLANYRSLPAIVDFTNVFISQAIPNNQINQTVGKVYAHRTDGTGEILWGEYSHLYHAAKWMADRIKELIFDKQIRPNEIAILAHRWKDLRFLQHFLQEIGVPYQFYDNSEKLRPSNSLIGQKILEYLRKDPDLKVDNPTDHLEKVRLMLGYSDQDVAWKSLLATLNNCKNITQEEICYLLEEAKTIRPEEVVLSTFHSAKGSEFAHVFVLEDGDRIDSDNSYESCARKLYVGFTRAKDSLSILFKKGTRQKNDPALVATSILSNNELNSGVSKIEIPTISLNHQSIRYQLILDPKDLHLSNESIVITSGRNRIDYYGHNWGDISIEGISFLYEYGSYDQSGKVAVLSREGQRILQKHLNQGITAKGYTIFRVDRDDDYLLENLRKFYLGDHHYVVLPCLEIEESLSN